MDIINLSKDIKQIKLGSKTITLIGTAHVSKKSALIVEETIRQLKPDNVCIELDENRYENIVNNSNKWEETDLINVIKEKKSTFLLINLILSSYQKRLAAEFDISPGQEMIAGINTAKEVGSEITLADRDLRTTFMRIFRKITFIEKMKILIGGVSGAFEEGTLTNDDIENLKESDFIENALNEMGANFPSIKTYLVSERDEYLSHKIKNARGENIVAVIGAAHMEGVLENIEKDINIKELSSIPKASPIPKIIGFSIPAIIIIMIVYSLFSNFSTGVDQISSWFFYNSVFSGLGALIAGGSILSIITAFAVAPITSLNPLVAAGWFAGIVEIFVRKPKVKDFESLSEDLESIKGLWKNKITKVLLITIFANIGSMLGTFLAGADIFSSFFSLFK